MSEKKQPRKRIEVISLKVVKESTMLYEPRKITSPKDAVKLAKKFLENLDREQVINIFLNSKNEFTAVEIVSIGSLNASIIHPREIFKGAISSNSASLIIAHNHPSGNPNPSKEDINITKRLIECGELLGVDVLNHIIIGNDDRYYSMKENSLI